MRERIEKGINLSKDELTKHIVCFVVAVILGGSKVASVFSPFSLALCMAVPIENTITAAAGSFIGIIIFGGTNGLIYIFSMFFAVMIRLLFRVKSTIANSVIAGVSLAATYIFTFIISTVGIGTVIMNAAECMLTMSMTYLVSVGLNGLKSADKTGAQTAGLAILIIALLLSLSQADINGFNIGVTVAAFLTIGGAVFYGGVGGSVIGLLCMIALSLYTKNYAVMGAVLAVSGFISGVFKPLGKLVQSIMFIGVYLLASAFIGGLTVQGFCEVSIAAIAAFVIPNRFIHNVRGKYSAGIKEDTASTDDLSLKLEFTARTLLDLQENIEKCADKIDEFSAADINKIYKTTVDKVCKDCGLKRFCWITNYQSAQDALNVMMRTLKDKGCIEKSDSPDFFRQKCCKLNEFVENINMGYREYLLKEQTLRRITEAREAATEQFSSMSSLLMDISREIDNYRVTNETAENTVDNLFYESKLECKRVSCLTDRYERMTIDVYINQRVPKKALYNLTKDISSVLDREFELPSVTEANGEYKISFFEEAAYKVDFYAVNFSKEGYNCCGDTYDYFIDAKGFAHIILSDGMGSGKRAAVDSVMTCATLKKLLQNGFGFDSAFKLINLSFSIKSNEESLATIDVCTIDLYTGEIKLIKAGAATSFIKKRDGITTFSANTLPIGIIQGVPYDSETIRLSKGDLIVMVSDGALISGERWIVEELKINYKKPAKEISKILLKAAKERMIDGHEDDITVIVAKLN